jgi:hypothetical protein
MIDRQEIVDLTIRYTWIIDHGPREQLREIFTDDAVFFLDVRRMNGVNEIIDKVDGTLGPLSSSQHLISNHQVQIDGNNATCSCYLQAQHTLHGTEGGDNYILAGHYLDELIRTDTGWRISQRELVIDWIEGNQKVVGR